jgi:imidazolonepropionase-like amidohydrolase
MAIKALKNVNIIDGKGGAPIEDAALLIEGKTILAVGSSREVKLPTGCDCLDGRGAWLLPGMIDLHVHTNNPPYQPVKILRQTLQAGFTTIGVVGGLLAHEGTALREAIEQDWVTGCSRIVHAAVVAQTHGHVKGRVADGPWEVRKAVREQVAAGAQMIKTASTGGFWAPDEECSWTDYTFEELDALVDTAHAMGRRVACHAHSQPGLNHAIRAGVDAIHHGSFIDDEALNGIKEKGLYYVPTLRVTSERNIKIKNECGRPWEARKMRDAHDPHRRGVKKAVEMGICLGLGTDMPGSPPWTAGESAVELIELVGCGLSTMEALQAATRNAAVILGLEKNLGTLEPGKFADFVLCAQNPLADISILYSPENILAVGKEGSLLRNLLS